MIASLRLALFLTLATPAVALAQFGGNGAAQQQAADTSLRLNRLEDQIRQLNGKNDELQFQIKQLQDQLKRFQGDVDFRLKDLEGAGAKGGGKPAGGAPPSAAPPQRRSDATPVAPQSGAGQQTGAISAPPTSVGAADPRQPAPGPQNLGALQVQPGEEPEDPDAGPDDPNLPMVLSPGGAAVIQAPGGGVPQGGNTAALAPSNSADDELALANGFLQRKDYEYAETQFRQFIDSYPQDKRLPDALYGLGESYFNRARYNDAIESYLKVVQGYGQSARAPDSLLRLGMTLAAIKEKDQACAALAEVGRKYPKSAAKSQADRELKRVGC